MDLAKIKSLIDCMAASDLAELEFVEDGWSLRLIRHASAPAAARQASAIAKGPAPVAPSAALVKLPSRAPEAPTVSAPMFGVVYLRSGPDADDFVAPGAKVAAGATLCIIEAMKVFSEIRAERDGVIAEVLVTSGQEVDFGQDLMRYV